MADLSFFEPSVSGMGRIVWQSGLLLLVGLIASRAWHRRPARAHRILFLAILGALAAPLCGQVARLQGWGLWASRAPITPSSAVSAAVAASAPVAPSPRGAAPDAMRSVDAAGGSEPTSRAVPDAAGRSGPESTGPLDGSSGTADRSGRPFVASMPLGRVGLILWWLVSGLCLARLVAALILGHRVVARARPLASGALAQAAGSAATRLGLGVRPELRASARAACPAIWCWGRRPVLLLPEAASAVESQADPSVDWMGVFCHELAHWVRRDHLSASAAELLTCVFAWNPLAWWAKHRLGPLSELACDEWVVASGREPVAYAETLLSLVPRRRMVTSLAAVSRRNGLSGRVAHLLEIDGAVEPRPGRRWSGLMGLAAVGLMAGVALAQSREGPAESGAMKKSGAPAPGPAAQPSPGEGTIRRVVSGTVRDDTGRPIVGASVFAASDAAHQQSVLSRVTSDRDGRFTLELALDRSVLGVTLVAKAGGMGLSGRNYSVRPDEKGQMRFEVLSEQPVELTLSPNIPIEGRLLSAAGVPVAGATVVLDSLSLGSKTGRNWIYLDGPEDVAGQPAVDSYWPGPALSDSQGRFRFDGFSARAQAELTITHADYVHEALTISTATELSDWHKQWGIKPVAPRFSHVLEPARPVEGVVTDRDTGRPIAGVAIEMAVSRAPEWRFRFRTTTDAQGRYRVVGVAWNQPGQLYTNVTPSVTSGYLPIQEHREEWPAGAGDLRWDFTLKKGTTIRGRVIDAETKQPIAGAGVAGGNSVQTDSKGEFTVSVSPGTRALFVEGPTPDYQRPTIPRSETGSLHTVFPHGFARIDGVKAGHAAPVEIALRKGATIAAQAVDPDGKPLPDVWVSGLSLYARGSLPGQTAGHYSNGLFRMSIFVPGQTNRIFFIQNSRHLAGFADLEAGSHPTGPVTVTLKPTASVKGRLLKPDGSPDRGKGVTVHLLMTRDPVKLDTFEFLVEDHVLSYGLASQGGNRSDGKTDDQGGFELRDLMAGVTNYVSFYVASNRVEYYPIEPLRPGEARDLGAIKPVVLTEQ
jgi:beta-lactamase regulating signal transducer with metallopeptidase domain